MERVKFYSINDLSSGVNIVKAEEVIKQYKSDEPIKDINIAIELYNIKKFFDKEMYLKTWSKETISNYNGEVKTFMNKIGSFFSKINDENFIKFYCGLDYSYKKDFWELVENFRIYKNISNSRINELLNLNKNVIYNLLYFKNIVYHFGEIIREFMLKFDRSAEILLDNFEVKQVIDRRYYFPLELSHQDKEKILNLYIDSEYPNLNYVRLIINFQCSSDSIKLSDKTKLRAKRKASELEEEFFNQTSGLSHEIKIIFSESQREEVVTDLKSNLVSISYGLNWIQDNTDYPTLLNNFIYLFHFVDRQMRWALVSKEKDLSIIEESLLMSSKNSYITGGAFETINILSQMQLFGYYDQLLQLGIRLEEVFEWFFNVYLENEFNVKGFYITMPSHNSSFLEKCRNIMPEVESVLNQFIVYIENDEIDYELLSIQSNQLIYSQIPSHNKKKYVYGKGEIFNTAVFYLFSSQSSLQYIERFGERYSNLYTLLCEEEVSLSDYETFSDKSAIEWLINNKFLIINNELIILKNKPKVAILKDLYFNEVISYWSYSPNGRKLMDDLDKEDIVCFESTLFSRPEQKYINFYLNKSQFNNGLNLRNKYLHSQPHLGKETKIFEQDYFLFLRILILTIIKVNDDFCIAESS